MIPNLYMKNGCFTKHPLQNGCLEFQDGPNYSIPPLEHKGDFEVQDYGVIFSTHFWQGSNNA